MKHIHLLVFAVTLLITKPFAADTLTVSFSASGAWSQLDSLEIHFPTQDTVVHLDGSDSLVLLTEQPVFNRGAHSFTPAKVLPHSTFSALGGRISLNHAAAHSVSLQIFDTMGRLRASRSLKTVPQGQLSLSLQQLSPGLYTAVGQTDTHTTIAQFVQLNQQPRLLPQTGDNQSLLPTPFASFTKATTINSLSKPFNYTSGDTLTITGWVGDRSESLFATIEADTHIVVYFKPHLYVTTAEVQQILATSAMVSLSVSADSATAIETWGVCYSTDSVPDISSSHSADSASAQQPALLSGLTPETVYFVRAYALNSDSVYYGSILSFSTDRDPKTLAVGDRYGGGWIGAFFKDGEMGYVPGEAHGLIVDTIDLGSYQWGCSTRVIGSTVYDVGSGKSNTDSINAICNDTQSAAWRCALLERNGFTDWFLPSLYELNKLYENRESIGMDDTPYYWSSSEVNVTTLYAWFQNFQTGANNQEHKQRFKLPVRAVRYF